MNYLAHLALSGIDENIIIGNFIGDFVKGKAYLKYPKPIQNGLILHRRIDFYTDNNEHILEGIHLIAKTQGKFAPILMDMYLDYFLANNFNFYYSSTLLDFQTSMYKVIDDNYDLIPSKAKHMYDYMKVGRWLERYKTIEGLEKSLIGLSKIVKYENNMDKGINELLTYKSKLNKIFNVFYPQIVDFCEKEILKLKLDK